MLVAARNEAETLGDCLTALSRLDYPSDRYEVLIGNDASTDETAFVALHFVASNPHFHLIDVQPQPTDGPAQLNGKANALAQLAQLARGDFLFITDADVRVPPTWLTGLLAEFGPNVGVVTGTTLVQGRGWWARLQAIDWLLAFGLIQLATYLRLPLTGSGNNMAVRRVAYEAVGGFAGLPFSVVEDYTLFQAIVAKGYGHAHRLRADVLAQTLPTPTLGTYLQQRKRWMQGAFSLPLPVLGGVLFQYLLVPILLVVASFAPKTALFVYLAKWLFQTAVAFWALQRTQQGHRWPDVFLYEPVQIGLGTLAFLYYLLPIPVRWKGRVY